jgi:prepilin-type N-terminal cleavage/methylation domain-containing protein
MSAKSRRGDDHTHDGFTLIEVMAVLSVLSILSAMAALQISAARPAMIGDAGMRLVMSQLTYARDTAIAQRRQVEITFPSNNAIRITRHDIPTPNTTVLQTVPLESGMQFGLLAGASDTPDAFGNGSATDFQNAATILFGTDGELIDQTGAPVNGTVFLMFAGQAQSFRSVTILGSTGRVRGYRWTGSQWTEA